MISRILLAVALAAPVVPAAAAQTEHPTTEVAYGDLNLASDAGVEVLQDRVRRAARKMCIETGARDLTMRAQQQACFDAAMANAARDVEVAVLEARSRMLASNEAGSLKLSGVAR